MNITKKLKMWTDYVLFLVYLSSVLTLTLSRQSQPTQENQQEHGLLKLFPKH